MGHDVHFLERLDRVKLPEVELAMRLYRDPKLVGFMLHRVRLPEGAERVAVSLDDPVEGPFIIVTREGGFVTCLARGMGVGQTPIVTRRELDGVAEHVEILRASIEGSMKDAGTARSGVRKLVGGLFKAGMFVSQEQFRVLEAWQPLLSLEYIELLTALWKSLGEAMDTLTQRKARRAQKRGHRDALHKSYWESAWAMHHLTVLVGMTDSEMIAGYLPGELGELFLSRMAWPGMRSGVMRAFMLDLWGVGRLGKVALGPQKKWFSRAQTIQQSQCTALGVLSIGLRHKGLRAETLKVLKSSSFHVLDASVADQHKAMMDVVLKLASEPEMYDLYMKTLADAFFKKVAADMPAEQVSMLGPDWMEDVDQDARLACLSYIGGADFRRNVNGLIHLLVLLPWCARADAQALFVPERHMHLIEVPWEMKMTKVFIDNHFEHNMEGGAPYVARARVGRNEPCPCGSGAKHKRCCSR